MSCEEGHAGMTFDIIFQLSILSEIQDLLECFLGCSLLTNVKLVFKQNICIDSEGLLSGFYQDPNNLY